MDGYALLNASQVAPRSLRLRTSKPVLDCAVCYVSLTHGEYTSSGGKSHPQLTSSQPGYLQRPIGSAAL